MAAPGLGDFDRFEVLDGLREGDEAVISDMSAYRHVKEIALRFAIYHGLVLGAMLVAAVTFLPGGLTVGGRAVASRLRAAWRPPAEAA